MRHGISDPSKVHFTGCMHFDHVGIIELAKRPFANIVEMNDALIARWNEVVDEDDTVIHVGDFGWHKQSIEQRIERLKGNIIFIRGNHDSSYLKLYTANEAMFHPYVELSYEGRLIVLCHYPIEDWNDMYKGSIHIHAHTHKTELISMRNRFNVTVEACNYTPISLARILELAQPGGPKEESD